MSAPILTTKLYIPVSQANVVVRRRLVDRLNAGLGCKLTLVSAPAGFGKTTLIASWLAQLNQNPAQSPLYCAWLSLDENDNDPNLFLTYLIAALQTAHATLGESVRAMLVSPQPPALQVILATLINELSALSDRLVLVLDDYHVINNAEIHTALAYLLNNMPRGLHLVLTTRADPSLPLSRLRVRQEIAEIRAEDLRFSTDEAAAFLQDVWNIRILPQHVAALEARTEGWIAGLQLAALSLQHLQEDDDIARFIADFTGSHRYVLDYLADEVLQQQSPEIQDFLLCSSILNRLCAELCDAVLETTGSQAMLESLEAANLFLVPLDQQRRWYRYHHLFGDLLRHRLKQARPYLLAGLHSRACTWYAAQNLTDEAIGHALANQDTARAANLIEDARWQVHGRGEIATLQRWLQSLPEEVVDATGMLAMTRTWMLLHVGKLEEAEAYLCRVVPRLDKAAEADPYAPQPWRGELAVIRTNIAMNRSNVKQMIEYGLQAREMLLADNAVVRGTLETLLGHGYRLMGDLAASMQAYETAVEVSTQANNQYARISALSAQGTLLEIQGNLHQSLALHQKGLALATDRLGRLLPIASFPLAGLGRVYREWNQLDEAGHYLEQGLRLSRQAELGTPLLDCAVTLALVRMGRGDFTGAHAALKEVIQHGQVPVISLRLAAVTARLNQAEGNLHAASVWAGEFMAGIGPTRITLPGDWFDIEFMILVRIWLAQGKPAQAGELLAHRIEAALAAGRNGRLVEMLALQALQQQAQGDTAQAVATLTRALAPAQAGGFVRVFVDEGQPMGELLARVAMQKSAGQAYTGSETTGQVAKTQEASIAAYARQLLRAFDRPEIPTPISPVRPAEDAGHTSAGDTPPAGDSLAAEVSPWLVEPLSERELEVLQLIAQGMSNREVGQNLVISVATVKKHVENIHGKLYVHNRTQAVTRARELGLL